MAHGVGVGGWGEYGRSNVGLRSYYTPPRETAGVKRSTAMHLREFVLTTIIPAPSRGYDLRHRFNAGSGLRSDPRAEDVAAQAKTVAPALWSSTKTILTHVTISFHDLYAPSASTRT